MNSMIHKCEGTAVYSITSTFPTCVIRLASGHRFEDPSAYRRPKVRARSSVASIIHVSDKAEKSKKAKPDRQLPIMKKSYDHSPHEVSHAPVLYF